jgi:hypothetical protein
MIRLLAEAAFALSGIGRILLFRPDWHERFNLTEAGLYRSFGAIPIGLPVYVLMQAFFARLTAAAQVDLPFWYYLVDLARLWLVFPLVAAIAVSVTGTKQYFAAWLTVRNWSVLAQTILVLLVAASAVAGLTDQTFLGIFFLIFYPAFLTALHLAIAFAVLKGPWERVAGAGVIVVLADFLSREGVQALAQALATTQAS